MAALDVAGTITNVKTMLGGLSAWQTIAGVDNSTDAEKRIYDAGTEDDGEETLAPCIVLKETGFNTQSVDSRGTFRGIVNIEARVELAVPDSEEKTYARQRAWVIGKCRDMAAGIAGAVNGGGQLMLKRFDMSLPPDMIDPDENQGRKEWGFIFSFGIEFL